MSDFPDVLGMELHDATALLEAEGLEFIIVETKPPKKRRAEQEDCDPPEAGQSALRVVKVQPRSSERSLSEEKQGILLTVCKYD